MNQHDKDKLVELLKQLLNELEPRPIDKVREEPFEIINQCNVCGIEWKGLLAYSCSNNKCPIQPKIT